MKTKLALVTLLAAAAMPAFVQAAEIDWSKVDAALGKSAVVSGEVHRYGLPRSDLKVTLDGVAIKPALALGGWVAFAPMGGEAMVMGDVVLLETEITPVMTRLLDGGLDITAIHNHVLRASPATFYMHVGGHGDPAKMAAVIRSALASSGTRRSIPPTNGGSPRACDRSRYRPSSMKSWASKAPLPAASTSSPCRAAIPPVEMGMKVDRRVGRRQRHQLSTHRQRQGRDYRRFSGDWKLGQSADPDLARNDIEVTAIHSHMLDEQPRMFFIHFWANDDALNLRAVFAPRSRRRRSPSSEMIEDRAGNAVCSNSLFRHHDSSGGLVCRNSPSKATSYAIFRHPHTTSGNAENGPAEHEAGNRGADGRSKAAGHRVMLAAAVRSDGWDNRP